VTQARRPVDLADDFGSSGVAMASCGRPARSAGSRARSDIDDLGFVDELLVRHAEAGLGYVAVPPGQRPTGSANPQLEVMAASCKVMTISSDCRPSVTACRYRLVNVSRGRGLASVLALRGMLLAAGSAGAGRVIGGCGLGCRVLRLFHQDRAGAAGGEVVPCPVDEGLEAIAETDEVHDVHAQPEQPRQAPADPELVPAGLSWGQGQLGDDIAASRDRHHSLSR